MMLKIQKNKDDPNCICVPGQYMCGRCETRLYKEAGRKMTQAQHAYDDYVTSPASDEDDYDDEGCCSCHINPPCNYCINKSEEEWE